MRPLPAHRLAICKRCRWPERIAHGAHTDAALASEARAWVDETGSALHVRQSQCLNCCDGGHTVRIESGGVEVALVGIRTQSELRDVLAHLDAIAAEQIPAHLTRRVYQTWRDGVMTFHRSLTPERDSNRR